MSNKELNYVIISELRDQLEAKEQMIKKLKGLLMETNLLLKETNPFLYGYLIEKIDEVLK